MPSLTQLWKLDASTLNWGFRRIKFGSDLEEFNNPDIRVGHDEDTGCTYRLWSVALTVGIVCDLAVARGANPRLHGRRGLPSECAIKVCPFFSFSEKWVPFEHVRYPRRPRSFMASLIINTFLKYTRRKTESIDHFDRYIRPYRKITCLLFYKSNCRV